MSASPVSNSPLFNFDLLGPVGLTLVLLFLAAGMVCFFLSFTSRYGRSRWPLHILLALGIVALGCGLASAGIGVTKLLGTLAISGGADPGTFFLGIAETQIAGFWYGVTGIILGLFAGIRAVLGLFREAGPKF